MHSALPQRQQHQVLLSSSRATRQRHQQQQRQVSSIRRRWLVGRCHASAQQQQQQQEVAVSATGPGVSSSAQAVLDRFQGLLREYRLHKAALGERWFADVAAQRQRPPQLLDAQATGDEALVSRCAGRRR